MPNDPRRALERLCAERGEDFAGLSRLLGKNPAYIQQYIRRGTPKRLKEDERRKLYEIGALGIRFLGRPALAVTGAVGVDLFYDESRLQRRKAIPPPIALSLFGPGCPGEGFSNGLIALTVQLLAEIDDIDLSQQDRHFSKRRMPTRPASGTRMALGAPQKPKRYA